MINFPQQKHLKLASASPRRVELLQQLGLTFTQVSVEIDERLRADEAIADYATRMAQEKVYSAWQQHGEEDCVILSADTCGEIAGQLLNKPDSYDDAKRILTRLSGNTHTIYSAFALFDGERLHVENVRLQVRFRPLSADDIKRYWATGEPCDKAGAYAIQGIGAQFVEHLDGSFSAVMGLPLFELAKALQDFDIRTL